MKNPGTFPFPTVGWPASDPLVTGVGGTYLCTDPVTGTSVDYTDPPANCQDQPNREIGWIDSGGGFSHVFAKPSYQDTLPAGSTPIGVHARRARRRLPGQLAHRRAGVRHRARRRRERPDLPAGQPVQRRLVRRRRHVAPVARSGPRWSRSPTRSPGHGLGLINPKLYTLATGPNYGTYFYDVTTGNNGAADPTVPGYPATQGWDPVTGLGTPNAANLAPALAAG